MKRFFSISVLLLFSLLSVSCSENEGEISGGGGGNVPPSQTGDLEEYVTDKVTILTEERKQQIVACDGTTLDYKPDTPDALLPAEGQILLDNRLSDLFPKGFYGKVTAVERGGDRIRVRTEWTPLSEAFTSLPEQTVDLSDYAVEFEQADGTVLPVSKVAVRGDTGIGSREEKVAISVPYKGAELTGSLSLQANLVLLGGAISDFGIRLDYRIVHELGIKVGKDFEFESKPVYLGRFKFRTIGAPVTLVLTPAIECYAQMKANGELSLSASLKSTAQLSPRVRYRNCLLSEIGIEEFTPPSLDFNLASLDVNASLQESVALDLKVELFGLEGVCIGLGPCASFTQAGRFSLDFLDIWQLKNGTAYASLKEAGISNVFDLKLRAYAKADLIKGNIGDELPEAEYDMAGNLEVPIPPTPVTLAERYILPAFDELEFTLEKERRNGRFRYRVARELFTDSIRLGYALYDLDDDSGRPLHTELSTRYYVKADMAEGRSFSFDVSGLDGGKNYYVRPLFSIFGTEMASDERAIAEAIVGKWRLLEQTDTYTDTEGHTNTKRCHHPGLIEFRADSTGVQTGIHFGDADDGSTDSELTWHSDARFLFDWLKTDDRLAVTVCGTENVPEDEMSGTAFVGTIEELSAERLVFSYPIGGTASEQGLRRAIYERIE